VFDAEKEKMQQRKKEGSGLDPEKIRKEVIKGPDPEKKGDMTYQRIRLVDSGTRVSKDVFLSGRKEREEGTADREGEKKKRKSDLKKDPVLHGRTAAKGACRLHQLGKAEKKKRVGGTQCAGARTGCSPWGGGRSTRRRQKGRSGKESSFIHTLKKHSAATKGRERADIGSKGAPGNWANKEVKRPFSTKETVIGGGERQQIDLGWKSAQSILTAKGRGKRGEKGDRSLLARKRKAREEGEMTLASAGLAWH